MDRGYLAEVAEGDPFEEVRVETEMLRERDTRKTRERRSQQGAQQKQWLCGETSSGLGLLRPSSDLAR